MLNSVGLYCSTNVPEVTLTPELSDIGMPLPGTLFGTLMLAVADRDPRRRRRQQLAGRRRQAVLERHQHVRPRRRVVGRDHHRVRRPRRAPHLRQAVRKAA